MWGGYEQHSVLIASRCQIPSICNQIFRKLLTISRSDFRLTILLVWTVSAVNRKLNLATSCFWPFQHTAILIVILSIGFVLHRNDIFRCLFRFSLLSKNAFILRIWATPDFAKSYTIVLVNWVAGTVIMFCLKNGVALTTSDSDLYSERGNTQV